jgi:hypothetical protein
MFLLIIFLSVFEFNYSALVSSVLSAAASGASVAGVSSTTGAASSALASTVSGLF